MISAPFPDNEQERLRRLKELDILDTLEEQAYDDLTHLAAQICDTPIALVSLIDNDRQWFKSHLGLEATETPRELAFCAHAILDDNVFIVEDSDKDERFKDNPLATEEPHVKFYAGAPLILDNNIHLGTLCVIDKKARHLSDEQIFSLEALARQVVGQLELRLKIKEMTHLDEAKDEFLAMVSHELRTPLTSIHGSLGLLANQAKQLPDDSFQLVDIAHRNTSRLLNIVNDILDLAKQEAGKFDINPQIVDLQQLAEQAVQLNQDYCKQCNCQIKFEPRNSTPIMINGDPDRLLQVLGNLISNAAKFTRPDDTIDISTEVRGNKAWLKITDHGSGLTEQQLGQLFEKFKQASTNGNHKLPGTGLGLIISKNIVELHQGEIGCESTPGVETTFFITIPIHKG